MLQRLIRFSPNIFTLANLSCGMVALVMIMNHLPKYATGLVLLSALFDLFDGRIARALKVTSNFGVELDSLADVVSFGVVPALAFYQISPNHLSSSLVLFLFPIAGVLRLARFNTRPTSGYFEGLPITAAGIILSLLLWVPNYGNFVSYVALILSFLMVSTITVRKL